MLKAGSLLYAIFICLMISILAGGLIYFFTLNKTMATRQEIKNELVDQCESCFQYIYSNTKGLKENMTQEVDLFNDGIKCSFQYKKWGMYQIMSGKTFFKKDTIRKSFMVGQKNKDRALALYLCDFGEELKVSGTTEIFGEMYLPKKRFKTVNILGNLYKNNSKVEGAIKVASQKLPRIVIEDLVNQKQLIKITLEEVIKNNINYNSFSKNTLIVYKNKSESLENVALKGNFILKSLDTLYIPKTCKFEDILVQGPKVVVEEGFTGSIQIEATKEVILEKNVSLKYPSVISIYKSDRDFEKTITISENSTIYGGVILDASSFREKQNNRLSLEENASIIGDVYCNGLFQHKGNVFGTVYVHKFELQTQSAKYADVVLNGIIDATKKPDFFVNLPLFNDSNNQIENIKSVQ
ncbi:hypothetical protein NBT05_17330 [Aquimarina sp. ERC-38]|uniref:hypothetical protein n=1 Tax=Aquimarina sp. ERC-38 TaxID=2949996 RepID=UPI002245C4CC|nr:hypothetical protein [Aquimarina sp. ERC-38]UZO80691.1 hypothetical protein NBT05_17330 [Aquimarina sp. ERC-38]